MGQKNGLFLSFCPHLSASSGQDGVAFEGGHDEAHLPYSRLIALN
jgi:hypothetical protein